jgi:cellulose biosynthesis protein BcsQ
VINQKGGVGKTSVVLGLVSAARQRGVPTLVVDLDPQGAAGWALGLEVTDETYEIGAALVDNTVGSAGGALVESAWGPGVDAVPAHGWLVEREADVRRRNPEQRLRRALEGVDDAHELTLIDCAPSLGLNATNALVAADLALIVAEPSALSLRGLEAVTDFVDEVWAEHNPDLDLAGVILNKVPGRSNEADRQIDELARLVGRRAIWKPPVPHRVVVNEALGARRPIHEYGSRAAEVTDAFDTLFAKLRRVARQRG